MRRKLHLAVLIAIVPAILALVSIPADAQQRGGGQGPPPNQGGPPSGGAPGHPGGPGGQPNGPAGRPTGGWNGAVVVGGGYWGGYYGYPYGGGPYWGGYWGPYGGGWGGYWGPYGYPGYYDNSAELRLEVKPKEAQVYVDGYYAGIVDDFDGTFQRLRVRQGNHEVVLYLKGYHALRQNLYLGARQTSNIKADLAPLASGEADEPLPQPRVQPDDAPGRPGEPPSPDEPMRPPTPPWPAEPPRPPTPPAPPGDGQVAEAQGFGALVIRVQPAGAEVLIDGVRWQGPEASERLVVQVAAGAHRIEVRKDGFVTFTSNVQVRAGETAPLNISLPPRGN
jgi:hypothetical protein